MKTFPTPIDVSPATADGTYQTVDLTTHIDAGDQGDVALAVFEVRNTVGTEHNHGIRPTGSTFDPLGVMEDDGHTVEICALDSSDQIDIAISNAAVEVHLLGYWVSSEAEGYLNPIDVTPTADDTYQDVDISTHTTGTAKVACLMMTKGGSGGATTSDNLEFRPNGSTDDLGPRTMFPGDTRGAAIPVDGSEIFEARVGSNLTPTIYLMGVITDNVTTNVDATAYDFVADGTFNDMDVSADTAADDVAILFRVHSGTQLNDGKPWGWRADGETHDFTAAVTCMQLAVSPIANQTIEGSAASSPTNSSDFMWVYAAFGPHTAGGATPTTAGPERSYPSGIGRGIKRGVA